jgi:hypothetical protein
VGDIDFSESKHLTAPPEIIYDTIADYGHHHGRILPPQFSELQVESGGRGAGTVITYKAKLGGVTRKVRARVEEPEPGRVLTEADVETGATTSFIVEPEGDGAMVTFRTVWTPKGIEGLLARLFAVRILRKVYQEELGNLERYARERVAAG